MTAFSVPNGRTTLEFEGELLGFASSKTDKPRWLELELYQMAAGNYLLAGVGKTEIPGETDRPWAHECTSAEEVIERLYMKDRDDVRYLTRAARVLLRTASAVDGDIATAYQFDVHTGAPGARR